MKKLLLFFCLSLLTFLANSQVVSQYLGAPTTGVKTRGVHIIDSILSIPKRLSALNKDTGSIYYRIVDSTIQVWTGAQWIAVGARVTASNGLIKDGNDIKLGRILGTTGAELSYDTEIPLNGHSVLFTDPASVPYTQISKNGIEVWGDLGVGSPARIRLRNLSGPYLTLQRASGRGFLSFGASEISAQDADGNIIITKTPGTSPTAFFDVHGTGRYRDTLTATTMGIADSSDRVATTAGVKRITASLQATPGGSNTQLQFNESGTFMGDAGLTYNSATNEISVDSIRLKNAIAGNVKLNRLIQNLSGGNDSLVIRAGVIRGDASAGPTQPITWGFITTGGHTKFQLDSIVPQSSGLLRLYYNNSDVVSLIVVPDETMAAFSVLCGNSVGNSYADISIYQNIKYSGFLQGNGTNNYNKIGNIAGWTFTYNSTTGLISFAPPSTLAYHSTDDIAGIQVTYAGTQNYRIRRTLSGIPGSDLFGFYVRDAITNTDVTNAVATSDIIQIDGFLGTRLVNANLVLGNGYNQKFFTAQTNLWIIGIFKK